MLFSLNLIKLFNETVIVIFERVFFISRLSIVYSKKKEKELLIFLNISF